MKITASEAMAKCLTAEGIKVVFGYPGAAICPFYDALINTDIRHILVRHEANAGHEASGYARITGKPAVCIATSGPGAVNLITAIATAYADSVPLICITGQVNRDQIGSDAFQEADITGAAEPFVKHSYLVSDAAQIPRIFKEAFYIAGTGRPGPVLIDVPMDVQREMIDFEYPETVDIRGYKPTVKGNPYQVKRVYAALKESEKPLICLGGGVFAGGAVPEVLELARRMQIPVITTMMGISAFPSDDELFYGMIGMHGCKPANRAVNDCDTLFLIGARVGDRAVRTPLALEKTTKIIHIDIDPAEIGKNINVDYPLVGDSKQVLTQLLAIAEPCTHDEWLAELASFRTEKKFADVPSGTVNPKRFIDELSQAMPDDSVICADVGQNQIWTCTDYRFRSGGRFVTSGGMGTMGYSLPAAIGAKLAAPDRQVCAICGDGALQMSMMELATAVQHDVNVKLVVMTNTRLGMVRELQTKGYDDRQTAVFLDGSPDFVKLAEAYGITALRVTDEESMKQAIARLAGSDERLLVEVVVDKDFATL
ncbi:acetolactate synthase, large subunit [Ruminococcus sp. YE71]|uniref:biosynthetic-type acetolactate synthase large subunit n=1 Tax=unclassified Ruminococcus TaxID=2608920 RepID=UPI0008915B1E|nr:MULTISPECIES: biosynthetic-type acetolactate synthase large subunit [unclassified Ruminococcus]SDA23185.1 acetolactate synthase, large subunit [Ruminococcus sp. YE78]SFW39392.1 acetolactate synthase, large subunit [Ruminococcus sp. YE71]